MIINIDYRRKEAIYEQIVSEIERYVTLGILEADEKIPSVRALAMELGINPNTVKKAYDILEEKGIIYSISTKGSFISSNTDLVKKETINRVIGEIEEKISELENLGLSRKDILKRLK